MGSTRWAGLITAAVMASACGDDDAHRIDDAGADRDAGVADVDTGPPAPRTIVPEARLPPPGTWEAAGVEGGIPERTAICADVTDAPYSADATGAASAVDAIQRAIDDCADGQVVMVAAGTCR